MKKKRILASSDIKSKEFVSMAFSHQHEKSQLITLSGSPDWVLVLWQWDKGKCVSHQNVAIKDPKFSATQCSFSILDSNSMLVTGNGVYKFFKLKDNGLKQEPHQVTKKEKQISENFTCHTWLPDGRIIICTDSGELILCESNGEFKMVLN